MRARRLSSWWGALGLLVAIRLAIPLAAYADSGSKLPGMPRWTYEGFRATRRASTPPPASSSPPGDGCRGRCSRSSGSSRSPRPWRSSLAWRRRPDLRPWLVPLALFAFGLVDLRRHPLAELQRRSGVRLAARLGAGDAAVPRARLRHLAPPRLGLRLRALARLRRAHRRRRRVSRPHTRAGAAGSGCSPPAFWTFWPLLVGLIAGHSAWANNQWDVDVGLHLYDEPLSTLLVTSGAALLLSPRLTPMRLSLAGCALSVATAAKVSNALLAAAALVIVFLRGRKSDTLPFLAGALAFAPVVLVYWPKSYPKLFNNKNSWPRDPFDPAHVVVELDALVDLHAAHARDRRAARRRRRVGRAPSVGARARARVPAAQSGLLQLLREHGAASALPLREPAGAVRALGRRHRGSRRGGSSRAAASRASAEPLSVAKPRRPDRDRGRGARRRPANLGAPLTPGAARRGRGRRRPSGQGNPARPPARLLPRTGLRRHAGGVPRGAVDRTVRPERDDDPRRADRALDRVRHPRLADRPPCPGRAAGCARRRRSSGSGRRTSSGSRRVRTASTAPSWRSGSSSCCSCSGCTTSATLRDLVCSGSRSAAASGRARRSRSSRCRLLGWLIWTRVARAARLAARRAFAVVGALPWLLGNLRHGWYSLHPGAQRGPWTNHVHNLVVSTLPEALGLRLAWSYEWVGGVVVG